MNTAVRSLSFNVITIGLVLGLALAPTFMARRAFAGDALLESFEQAYGEIINKVEKGKLDAGIGARANELKIGLRKYLIKTDAQMEILELDVLHGSVEKRKRGLQKIAALSAERERIKMGYLQRLQGLTKSGEGLLPLLPVEPEKSGAREASTEEKKAEKKEDDSMWGISFKDIEIIIEPEDLSKGEVP